MKTLLKTVPWLFFIATALPLLRFPFIYFFNDHNLAITTTAHDILWLYVGLASLSFSAVFLVTLIQIAVIDVMPDLPSQTKDETERLARLGIFTCLVGAPTAGAWLVNRVAENFVKYHDTMDWGGRIVVALYIVFLMIMPWWFWSAYQKQQERRRILSTT